MDTKELELRCACCKQPVLSLKCLPCLHSIGICEKSDCRESLEQEGVFCSRCKENFRLQIDACPTHTFAVRKAFQEQHDKEGLHCNEDHETPKPAVVYCSHCPANLCQECWDHHKSRRVLSRHTVLPLEEALRTGVGLQSYAEVCTDHGEAAIIYCHTCQQMVCLLCTKTGSHQEHTFLRLDDKLKEKAVATLSLCASSSESTTKRLNSLSKDVDSKIATLKQQAEGAKAKVAAMIEDMLKEVRSRGDVLIAEIERVEEEGRNELETFKEEEINSKLIKLATYKEITEELVSKGIPEEQVSLKRAVVDRMAYLSNVIFPPSFPVFPSVYFEQPLNLSAVKAEVSAMGLISRGVCPANCTMEGVSVSQDIVFYRPWADTPLSFDVITKDNMGKQCVTGGEMVQAVLTPTTCGVPLWGEVRDQGDGTYSVTFQQLPADHSELLVTVNGDPIKGGPLTVKLMCIRDVGVQCSHLEAPNERYYRAVTVGRDGQLMATDNLNREVCLFNTNGVFLSSFKLTKGTCYNGIAELSQGNIAVSCYDENFIMLFSSNGRFMRKFGSSQLKGPRGLAVLSNRLFVADRCNHRVCVFTEEGQFLHAFGGAGSDPENLNHPDQVAVSNRHEIYVTDTGNKCVKVYQPNGIYTRKAALIDGASGLTVMQDGHVVVTSFWNKEVVIFSPKGLRVHSFTAEGPEHPYGIVFGRSGHLYAANLAKPTISQF